MQHLNNDTPDELAGFETITLEALEQASLLSRVEQKYIVPDTLLKLLLEELVPTYKLLCIQGKRTFRYYTRYFDSHDFRLYNEHHNGYVNRMKVRYRMYEDSQDCFFEIKYKKQDALTEKTRQAATLKYTLDNEERKRVVHSRLGDEELVYKLSNRFQRITLCNKNFTERLTIDTCINMFVDNNAVSLPDVAIIERKTGIADSIRPISLLKPYIAETGFSKYAVGVARLYPAIKHNNFKPILLNLSKYAHQ